jgi:hypothetical protein
MPDLSRAKVLGLGWKAQERVDLALRKEIDGLRGWIRDPAKKFMLISASPEETAPAMAAGPSCSTYWTSVKPSPRRSSSATY